MTTTRRSINLLDPDVLADPYPEFARLRAEDPVHFSGTHGAWLITRFDDVYRAFHDHQHLSSDRITPALRSRPAGQDPVLEVLGRWMVFRDPPDHGRLRKLVHLTFTPRRVETLRARMQAIVDELLDGLTDGVSMDVLRDFAYPLPAIVIAELLGAPSEDRDRFKAWSDDITPLVFGAAGTADRHQRAQEGVAEFLAYVRGLIAQSRQHRGDSLLDALVAATDDGQQLSDDELEATALLLLFAGHETTTNLITNTLLVLLEHPAARAAVVARPELTAAAVEETLRYEGPAKAIMRWVARDLELHGRTLKRGDRALLVMGSANRDEERFASPDTFDMERERNQHLGFGHGPHYCLGAALARAEAQIAVGTLLRRFPDLQLADVARDWQPQILSRAVRSLPVTY